MFWDERADQFGDATLSYHWMCLYVNVIKLRQRNEDSGRAGFVNSTVTINMERRGDGGATMLWWH